MRASDFLSIGEHRSFLRRPSRELRLNLPATMTFALVARYVPMNITRRLMIKLGVLSAAVLIGLAAVVRELLQPADDREHPQPAMEPQPTSLDAVVDTFFPADETPGAAELGVHVKVHAWGQSTPKLQRLLEQLCAWLDRESQRLGTGHFAALDAAQRDRLLRRLAAGDAGRVMQRFVLRLRNEAFTHYYGERCTWAGLHYSGPPQPAGFIHYTEAPRKA